MDFPTIGLCRGSHARAENRVHKPALAFNMGPRTFIVVGPSQGQRPKVLGDLYAEARLALFAGI